MSSSPSALIRQTAGVDQVSFDLIFKDVYVIAKIGDRKALIDTGCPLTGTNGEPFCLFGKRISRKGSFGTFSLSETSRLMGIHLDAIVGMDVLGRYPWLLDWQGRKINFFRKPQKFGGTVVPVRQSAQSHIVVDFEVAGEKKEAILDTGAPLQFKDADFACGDPVREQEDFSPLISRHFATPVYRTPIRFAGEQFETEFGVLPDELQSYLSLVGVRWVLGGPCLKRHPVYWDIPNRCIHVLNKGGADKKKRKGDVI